MAKLSQKGLLGIALLLSFATAALIYNYLQQAVEKPVAVDGELVIVAKVDIPPKTRIVPEMVQEVRIPREYIQAGTMRELPKVIGVMTREQIISGEQVLERRLLLEGKQAGFSGVIPAGKRAVTLAATEITAISGLLKTGDYVDVFVTFDQQAVGDHVTQLLLQNALVLAVNRDSAAVPDKEAPPANTNTKKEPAKDALAVKIATITLAVTPDEVVKLTLAEEKGKVRFALRPYIPEDGKAAEKPVTPKDIVGVHKSPTQQNRGDNKSAGSGGSSPSSSGGNDKDKKADNPFGVTVIRGTKSE